MQQMYDYTGYAWSDMNIFLNNRNDYTEHQNELDKNFYTQNLRKQLRGMINEIKMFPDIYVQPLY